MGLGLFEGLSEYRCVIVGCGEFFLDGSEYLWVVLEFF